MEMDINAALAALQNSMKYRIDVVQGEKGEPGERGPQGPPGRDGRDVRLVIGSIINSGGHSGGSVRSDSGVKYQ